MKIGIPKERLTNEARVAATPKTVEQLLMLGFSVVIEQDAGLKASFADAAYQAVGATVVDGMEVWLADVILAVNAPGDDEISLMRSGSSLISFIWPAQNPDLLAKLAAQQINVLAMDSVPRISRAQSMDALSSMANIAGYRAIIEAAHEFGRFFTGQITAAGKVPPAKVMSPAFIAAEMALFAAQAREVDIIVTTALIPGKPAPRLITRERHQDRLHWQCPPFSPPLFQLFGQ